MDGQSGSAARVGFVLFIALVLVIVGVYLVGDGGGFFREYARYKILFDSTTGLRVDAPVWVNGVPAGKVEDIGFSTEGEKRKILVQVGVQKHFSSLIREDSFAWLQSQGLLGDKVLQIQAGSEARPRLAENAAIPQMAHSLIQEMVPAELVSGTADLLENMISLLKEVNAGKGTVGQLLHNPELYANLNKFTTTLSSTTEELAGVTKDLRDIIGEVRQQKGTLGKLIFSEDYAAEFGGALQSANRVMESLTRVMDPIVKGEGTLGRLLRDDQLHRELDEAVKKVSLVAGSLEGSLRAMSGNRSALGRMVEDPELGKKLESLAGNLERSSSHLEGILAKIDSGEGSLGMLVHDPSIAGSVRDIVLGVRESGFLMGVARRAEETGRAIRYRDERLAVREGRREAEGGRRPPEGSPEGQPQPATGKEGESKPIPAPLPPGKEPAGESTTAGARNP